MEKVVLEQRSIVEDLSKVGFETNSYLSVPKTSLVISDESNQYAFSAESWGYL